MKSLFFLLLFSIGSHAFACGFDFYDDEWYYFNLFEQTNISNRGFYPFLNEGGGRFYRGYNSPSIMTQQGNLQEWKDLLSDWKDEQVYEALTTDNEEDYEKIWATKKSNPNAKAYMDFARACSEKFQLRSENMWDYEKLLNDGFFDVSALLKKGQKAYKKAKNAQLKMRYAYQIVRLLHYSNQYEEAILFFHKKVKPVATKNEAYYYMLDQVAGCEYSLKNYEKAAYLFLKVFENSEDRKTSAFISYRFCTDKGAEGKKFFEGPADNAVYTLIKSMRSFSDEWAGLETMMQQFPTDPKTELLFMRKLNSLEREIMPSFVGFGTAILPHASGHEDALKKLTGYCQNMYGNQEIENKDFWKISEAYIAFLNRDFKQADALLLQVEGDKYNDQIKVLEKVFEVFAWDKMEQREENRLMELLDNGIVPDPDNYIPDGANAWHYVVWDHVGHLYYKNNQLAKAFLSHNRFEDLDRALNPELLDALEAFVKKEAKTDLENLLLGKTLLEDGDISGVLASLDLARGFYHLQNNRPHKALESLSKLKKQTPHTFALWAAPISAKVFSSNVVECYDCAEWDVMNNDPYFKKHFKGKAEMQPYELAEFLIDLEMKAANGDAQASYWLGNYHYNVSNTGFFRGELLNTASYRNDFPHHHMGQENNKLTQKLQAKTGHTLYDIRYQEKLCFYDHATQAFKHYKRAVNKLNNAEWEARTTFLMAKCELNNYYNETLDYDYSWDFYKGEINEKSAPYKTAFKILKTRYTDTAFYEEILQECSYFAHYCAN